MTVHVGCDDYYTHVICPGQSGEDFSSHPPVIVTLMERHLLPGALADAFLLAVTLVFLYVAVLAAATFTTL